MQDGILSIQSAVAYGHVGNSAAVFPLQRLGFEVWPVNTVLFSNHTGYGAWRGFVVPVDQVREIVAGIEDRGVLPRCRALLSGYLGDAALGSVVLDTLRRVRARRPDVLYTCDPVMGDGDRGFFVRPGIPEFFRDEAVPAADIVTPNQFELAWLAGREIGSVEDALAAAAKVRSTGPRLVCCTSLETADRPGELAVLADTEEGSWIALDATAGREPERHGRRLCRPSPGLSSRDGPRRSGARAGHERHVRPGRGHAQGGRQGAPARGGAGQAPQPDQAVQRRAAALAASVGPRQRISPGLSVERRSQAEG